MQGACGGLLRAASLRMNARQFSVLFLVTVLLCLRPIRAGDDDKTDGCDDGDVRLSNSDNEGFEDVKPIDVCEDQLWKSIVPCGEEWTRENMVVACRELGYAAPGNFRVYNRTVIEERRRLSYKPQCTGMEDRLVNCTHHDTQCEDAGGRVVISCLNSSTYSSQPSLPFPTHTPAVQTSTIISKANMPSILPTTTTTPSDSSLHPYILYGALSAVVGLLMLGILLVLVCICCRRKPIKPPLVEDHGYDYELPISSQNKTFHEVAVPETEALYDGVRDQTTTVLSPGVTQLYHTLNHSPASSHSPALSHSSATTSKKTASTDLPLNEVLYEKVVPVSGRRTAQHSDPPQQKPPVYYHILESTKKETTPKPHYHTLEEPRCRGDGAEPMYHEVGQRRAATLPNLRARPPLSELASQPYQGSVTLL